MFLPGNFELGRVRMARILDWRRVEFRFLRLVGLPRTGDLRVAPLARAVLLNPPRLDAALLLLRLDSE